MVMLKQNILLPYIILYRKFLILAAGKLTKLGNRSHWGPVHFTDNQVTDNLITDSQITDSPITDRVKLPTGSYYRQSYYRQDHITDN